MPERRLDPRESQWAVQATARGILSIGLVLGVLIVVGGDVRWSSPSYETALTYPYAPESWGYVLGSSSLVGLLGSLSGRLRVVAVGLFMVAVWCLFFAISFIQTASERSDAATTGIPMYVGVAIGSLLVGVVHWRSSTHATQR